MKTSRFNTTLASAAALTFAAVLSLPAHAEDRAPKAENLSIYEVDERVQKDKGNGSIQDAPVSNTHIGGVLPDPGSGDGSDPSDSSNNGFGGVLPDPSSGDGSTPANNNGFGGVLPDPSSGDGSTPSDPSNAGFDGVLPDPSSGDGSVAADGNAGFGSDDRPTVGDHRCRYDINDDQRVDQLDLSILLKAWGTSFSAADGNNDGLVDAIDMIELIADWGMCG
jgi:hypothetical protein